ncbi:TPA: hypothetical protein UMT89_000388 [Stenotrophomonas maltophilia]|nr:hypothetical protein [Stenotrophomonas maltophilia]
MSKICKSVLLPPALIAMLGLAGIASASQESASNDLTRIQNASVLDITLVSGTELQEGTSDNEIAGVQCTNYSSGGTHCGHYSSGDAEELQFAHVVPDVQKFNV